MGQKSHCRDRTKEGVFGEEDGSEKEGVFGGKKGAKGKD